jgi:hypothetical protein
VARDWFDEGLAVGYRLRGVVIGSHFSSSSSVIQDVTRSEVAMKNHLRFAAALLCTPAVSAAQPLPIPIPKALIFPNYDNVLVGQNQALEAGAYIARVGDASANFYNPAGLVVSEKTSLNASSTGYIVTRISSESLNTSVTSTKIDNAPGYFGVVIAPPFTDSRNLRLGASITRGVAWSPGPIDQTTEAPDFATIDRVTYSSDANFQTLLYQIAAAWAPVADRSLRFGIGLGVSQTSYSAESTLSGLLSLGGQPGHFLSTLRAEGDEWDVIFTLGAQWEILRGLTVGALVRSSGLRIGSGSLLTYESAFLRPDAPTSSFFRDENGQFQYKQPWEASLGIAYHFGIAELEADLRFHDAVSPYAFYHSDVPLQILVQNPDGTITTSTQPAPSITYSARRVYNVAVGGNVKLSRTLTLHGGFHATFSPVADPLTSPLRQADLYGFTGGLDLQLEHFGASLGAGYQFGTSATIPAAINDQELSSKVTLEAISVFYAVSYQF